MKLTVDAGGRTWLPLCACGWRGLPCLTRSEALQMGRHHELRAHPGDKDVLRQMYHNRSN